MLLGKYCCTGINICSVVHIVIPIDFNITALHRTTSSYTNAADALIWYVYIIAGNGSVNFLAGTKLVEIGQMDLGGLAWI